MWCVGSPQGAINHFHRAAAGAVGKSRSTISIPLLLLCLLLFLRERVHKLRNHPQWRQRAVARITRRISLSQDPCSMRQNTKHQMSSRISDRILRISLSFSFGQHKFVRHVLLGWQFSLVPCALLFRCSLQACGPRRPLVHQQRWQRLQIAVPS